MGRAKLSLEVQLVIDVPEKWGRKGSNGVVYLDLEELAEAFNKKQFTHDLILPIDFNADRPTLILRGEDVDEG